MPKMKSVKGASKRFKIKSSGQIKRGCAYKSHILTKMSPKRKMNLTQGGIVDRANIKAVKLMLCK